MNIAMGWGTEIGATIAHAVALFVGWF